MDAKALARKLNAAAKEIEFTPPKEVIRLFKYQIVPSGMGTGGQAFTTMVFAEGDARALASYLMWTLTRLVDNDSFTLDQLKTLFRETIPLSAEFLMTCGLESIWTHTKEVADSLDQIENREDFKEVVDALSFFLTTMHNWVHLFFPWYIGELFPQKKKKEIDEMVELVG